VDSLSSFYYRLSGVESLSIFYYRQSHPSCSDNHRIRVLTAGNVTTIAGSGPNGYTGGFGGDGGAATSALLYDPGHAIYAHNGVDLLIAGLWSGRARCVLAVAQITALQG